MSALQLGDLSFDLRWSPRRRTAEIIIERDGTLAIVAPTGTDMDQLAKLAEGKREAIYRKLAERDLLAPDPPPREYVTGEGFPYLGRSYRLLLTDEQPTAIRFDHGRFLLRRRDASDGRAHLVRWYTEHGRLWLRRRLPLWEGRLGATVEAMDVRDLGFHWGSFGKGGRIYFHWKTVLLPPDMIDYVIVHELAHFHEPNHTAAFWQRVERAMPDYEARKLWLAERGAEITAV